MMVLPQEVYSVHGPLIWILIFIGLGTNSMFLMSLKGDKSKLNYNDKVQVVKTFFVIGAMIFYIPAELWVLHKDHVNDISCLVKNILQSVFLDTLPMGTAAVAFVRFRLAFCRGDASVLVNKYFYILATACCFLLSFVVAAATATARIASMNLSTHNATANNDSICYEINTHGVNVWNIGRIVTIYVFPSIVVVVLYVKIISISFTSINRIQEHSTDNSVVRLQNRSVSVFGVPNIMRSAFARRRVVSYAAQEDRREEKIWKSISILVGAFLISTVLISSIEIYLSAINTDLTLNIVLLYVKVSTCILHAIGEGTFFRDKRRRVSSFLNKFLGKRKSTLNTRRVPVSNACPENNHLSPPRQDLCNSQHLNKDRQESKNLQKVSVSPRKGSSTIKDWKSLQRIYFLKWKMISLNHPLKSTDSHSKEITNPTNVTRIRCPEYFRLSTGSKRSTEDLTLNPDIVTSVIRKPSNSNRRKSTRGCEDSFFSIVPTPTSIPGCRLSPLRPNRLITTNQRNRLSSCTILSEDQELPRSPFFVFPETPYDMDSKTMIKNPGLNVFEIEESISPHFNDADARIRQDHLRRLSLIFDIV